MKRVVLYSTILLIAIFFNACTSFHEEYKPLYQAKPKIEPIKRNN